jgi:hypothetical protein
MKIKLICSIIILIAWLSIGLVNADIKDVDYNTASEYTYNNTLIEFNSGVVSLSGSGTYSIEKPYVKYDTDFIWRPLNFDKLNSITPFGVIGTVEYSFEIDGVDKWWNKTAGGGAGAWETNSGELREGDDLYDNPAGLVSVWHFNSDSTPGTATDSKGSNTGTLTPGAGGTNTSVAHMWDADGKLGSTTNKAIEFDGTDDYVDCADNIKPTSISILAWVCLNNNTVAQSFVERTQGYGLRNMGGKIYGLIQTASAGWGSGVVSSTPAGDIPQDQWTHVAMTYKASTGTMIVYVNGVDAGQNSALGGNITYVAGKNLRLGSSSIKFVDYMPTRKIINTAIQKQRLTAI